MLSTESPRTLSIAKQPNRRTFAPVDSTISILPSTGFLSGGTHQIDRTGRRLDQRIHLIRNAHLSITRLAHRALELPTDRVKCLCRDLSEVDDGTLALSTCSILNEGWGSEIISNIPRCRSHLCSLPFRQRVMDESFQHACQRVSIRSQLLERYFGRTSEDAWRRQILSEPILLGLPIATYLHIQ
jgi:hypothetical protein